MKLNIYLPYTYTYTYTTILLLLILAKRNESTCPYKDLYINVYKALLIIDKNWKEPKCLSRDEGTFCYIHTMEYNSAIKRNELLIHVTKWIMQKNYAEQKKLDKRKSTYCIIPFI